MLPRRQNKYKNGRLSNVSLPFYIYIVQQAVFYFSSVIKNCAT